jgi:hypothetical protein
MTRKKPDMRYEYVRSNKKLTHCIKNLTPSTKTICYRANKSEENKK